MVREKNDTIIQVETLLNKVSHLEDTVMLLEKRIVDLENERGLPGDKPRVAPIKRFVKPKKAKPK